MKYIKTDGVRMRPDARMQGCLMSVPGKNDVITLNPAAWFIYQMCDEFSEEDLVASFEKAAEKEFQGAVVRECLRSLEQTGAIRATTEASS